MVRLGGLVSELQESDSPSPGEVYSPAGAGDLRLGLPAYIGHVLSSESSLQHNFKCLSSVSFYSFIFKAKVLSHTTQTAFKFVISCLGYWDYRNQASNSLWLLLDSIFGPGSSLETSSMTQGVKVWPFLQQSPLEVHAGMPATHCYALHAGLRMEPRCEPFIKRATSQPNTLTGFVTCTHSVFCKFPEPLPHQIFESVEAAPMPYTYLCTSHFLSGWELKVEAFYFYFSMTQGLQNNGQPFDKY